VSARNDMLLTRVSHFHHMSKLQGGREVLNPDLFSCVKFMRIVDLTFDRTTGFHILKITPKVGSLLIQILLAFYVRLDLMVNLEGPLVSI